MPNNDQTTSEEKINIPAPVVEEQYAKVVFKQFAQPKQCEERADHQQEGVWQLDITNFHPDLKAIDPKAYFITSGEATIKADKLCEDLKKALIIANKLKLILKAHKSNAKYLESQWDNSKLLLKQKNSRPPRKIPLKETGGGYGRFKRREPDPEPERGRGDYNS